MPLGQITKEALFLYLQVSHPGDVYSFLHGHNTAWKVYVKNGFVSELLGAFIELADDGQESPVDLFDLTSLENATSIVEMYLWENGNIEATTLAPCTIEVDKQRMEVVITLTIDDEVLLDAEDYLQYKLELDDDSEDFEIEGSWTHNSRSGID